MHGRGWGNEIAITPNCNDEKAFLGGLLGARFSFVSILHM
jgi:hypothetical protein